MAQNAPSENGFGQRLAKIGPARRDDMLTKLADLFGGVSHLLDNGGVDTFDSIFVSLIPVCSDTAKTHLSDTIAANPRAPKRAIRHLAFDDTVLVAKPVICLSPLLLDDELLAIATVQSPQHLMAMCERATLSPGVTDVILSRADGEIMVALVSNAGARFSEKGSQKLAEAALDDGGLYDIVMVRDDLASKVAFLEATDDHASINAATPLAPVSDAPDLDTQLRDALANGQTDRALGLLAKKLTIPATAVAKAFALDIHGGFLAYAKAVPLSWDTTMRFLMVRYAAGQVAPKLQRAEEDFRRLLVSEARRVTQLLGQHAAKPH